MEKFDVDISLKNIGFVSHNTYENMMVDAIEDLIYRMRWKYYHFKQDKRKKSQEIIHEPDSQSQHDLSQESISCHENMKNNCYGLRTNEQAPRDADLKPWEDDMLNIVHGLKKRDYKSVFQDKIRNIESRLRSTDKILISSDKTDNHYLITKDDYMRHLRNCITKNYRKSNIHEVEEADYQAACLAKKLDIQWRLEKTALKSAFITVKDHKEDWPSRMSFRLINPMKANIGRVSKVILERINNELRSSLGLNQVISTKQVIDWFRRIERKENKMFFQCDIENFYPSISKELLTKSLEWAKTKTFISETAIEVIFCARRNVLNDGENIWVQKGEFYF